MRRREINTIVMRSVIECYRKRQIDHTTAIDGLKHAGVADSAIEALLRAEPVMVEPAKHFTAPPRLTPP